MRSIPTAADRGCGGALFWVEPNREDTLARSDIPADRQVSFAEVLSRVNLFEPRNVNDPVLASGANQIGEDLLGLTLIHGLHIR
jgi:hypothetical protein